MATPKLLLFITDPELEKQLLASSAIRQFTIMQVSGAKSWIEHLMEDPVDVAIAQVDEFSEKDLKQLTDTSCRLLSKIDVIFVSSGEPNPYIDQAMIRGVAYHLRFPINTTFIDEIATDLFEELTEDTTNRQAVVESDLDQFGLLVGSSAKMKRLYRVIRKSSDSDASIFIIGESGSGKELVANTLHMMSERCDEAFISINCGAISPELIESELFGHIKGAFTGATNDRVGVFEQADGGTLFLDEVTEMPIDHQVKLLRVLETGEYRQVGSSKTKISNARIIAATNREPGDAIEEEIFREDLYYRLAQFPVRVPPLRDREGDVIGLAKHFLAHRNAEEKTTKEISADAIAKIESHDWPGNVRELMHTMERAYILADDSISVDNLIIESMGSSVDDSTIPTNMPLDEIEKSAIINTLEENDGNKTETAEQLGISVKTLYNKLEKYGDTDS
ncbi:MAG: sigma-54-dependent Fis family transcriptional regulator [Pseudohongiella sp.]|nr:MAG: sigma-54-dependent Fis family transcriptional regulator [Pseudohongiella sp.]